MELDLPPSLSNPDLTSIETQGAVVVVGANGSGKTRLGSWIELDSRHRENAHRVSAQKSLNMPSSSRPGELDEAKIQLLYGHTRPQLRYKRTSRWGGNPNTALLNDFEKLMVYLFSDQSEKSVEYTKRAKQSESRIEPPDTKLDTIERIWESILPNRNLVIGSAGVEVRSEENPDELYNASEMSDGERVIFYLIGECLSVPDNAIVVIDEPEMHLHRSIQGDLWDAIETERSDCLFVYLTHDVDFASSRVGAPKVCLREFDGENWDWYLIPADSPIPDEIMLEIVGSRKPVLFIEGEKDSLDYLIFNHLYPEFTVVPCGSCAHVIHATGSFASLSELHHLECRGVVDRDHRTDDEVENLQGIGIHVLEVSEIENLLLHEDILRYVGSRLEFEDKLPEIVEEARSIVFDHLEEDKRRVAASAAASAIQSSLASFDPKVGDEKQMEESWENFVESIDAKELYTGEIQRIEDILAERDYEAALRVYDNKGLIYQVSPLFDMKAHGLVEYIGRLISNERDEDILDILQQYVPRVELDESPEEAL